MRACGTRRVRVATARRGFTLIEVLVALTIASVALIASLRAISSLTQSTGDLRLRALAQWSAENRLAEVRITSTALPPLGRKRFACPQGDVALECEEAVFEMPAAVFRRVEVTVYGPEIDGRRDQLAKLVGFATNLPRQ